MGFLFPAIVTAVCFWGGAAPIGILLHRVFLLLQLVLVGIFGYQRLTAFDRQLQEVYADSDSYNSRPVRMLLLWFIAISFASGIFCIIGRQFFRQNDWLLIVPSILFSVMLFSVFYVGYNRQNVIAQLHTDLGETESIEAESEISAVDVDTLAAELQRLMEEKHLFLRPNIKIGEIAQQIGTCRTYLSNYLNHELGMSFSDYINRQRIDYAKQLISYQKPEKINQVASLSGFSSETSFYRNFKKLEGMTPEEWVANHGKKP